jgi:hypothetical protein
MIMAYLYWGKLIDQGSRINFKRLLISHLFRLYPLYLLFAILLTISCFKLTNLIPQEGGRA